MITSENLKSIFYCNIHSRFQQKSLRGRKMTTRQFLSEACEFRAKRSQLILHFSKTGRLTHQTFESFVLDKEYIFLKNVAWSILTYTVSPSGFCTPSASSFLPRLPERPGAGYRPGRRRIPAGRRGVSPPLPGSVAPLLGSKGSIGFRSPCEPSPPKPFTTPLAAADATTHLNGGPALTVGGVGRCPRLEQRLHLLGATPGRRRGQTVCGALHVAPWRQPLALLCPGARPSLSSALAPAQPRGSRPPPSPPAGAEAASPLFSSPLLPAPLQTCSHSHSLQTCHTRRHPCGQRRSPSPRQSAPGAPRSLGGGSPGCCHLPHPELPLPSPSYSLPWAPAPETSRAQNVEASSLYSSEMATCPSSEGQPRSKSSGFHCPTRVFSVMGKVLLCLLMRGKGSFLFAGAGGSAPLPRPPHNTRRPS